MGMGDGDYWFAPPTTFDDVIAETLRSALDYLSRRLGPEPGRWRWGDLHRVTFAHPLGIGPLARILSRGGFPLGGDIETVAQAASNVGDSFAATGSIPSYRFVVDLSDFDRSVGVLATGQSGHPGSRHYDDQTPLWRAGRYHPLPFSRRAVVESIADVLTLLPA